MHNSKVGGVYQPCSKTIRQSLFLLLDLKHIAEHEDFKSVESIWDLGSMGWLS